MTSPGPARPVFRANTDMLLLTTRLRVDADGNDGGGVPVVLKMLLDAGLLHGDCLTVTGKTIRENLADVKWNPDQDVVRPLDNPLRAAGSMVILKGNLAPEGAVAKVAGLKQRRITGPAKVFDGEEACFQAIQANQMSLDFLMNQQHQKKLFL